MTFLDILRGLRANEKISFHVPDPAQHNCLILMCECRSGFATARKQIAYWKTDPEQMKAVREAAEYAITEARKRAKTEGL